MATTLEFGTCERCKGSNSKVLDVCRHCGAPLSWAKARVVKATRAPKTASHRTATRPTLKIDWTSWAVGVFSFIIPILGYFLYRSYANSGSDRATAAGMGALLGVLFHIVRITLKFTTQQG